MVGKSPTTNSASSPISAAGAQIVASTTVMRGHPFLRAVQAVVWLPETVLSGLRFCDELVEVLDEAPETRGESCRGGTVDGVVADADREMKTGYGAKVHEQPRPTAMVCAVGVG
jgi:hypothetical protein